jgi:hypothetical protein
MKLGLVHEKPPPWPAAAELVRRTKRNPQRTSGNGVSWRRARMRHKPTKQNLCDQMLRYGQKILVGCGAFCDLSHQNLSRGPCFPDQPV